MTPKPSFAHLNIGSMIAAAGGDPWAIEDQLHAGDAGAINDLADAFHRAGGHLQETDDQFNKAKEQFASAYNRSNGSEHPINDSAEVQRMSKQLAGHPEQLAKIGAALEQTAAALATAQRDALAEIAELDKALHSIDDEISAAGSALTPIEAITLLEEADDQTKMSLGTLQGIQGAYIDQLHSGETAMLGVGYVPDALGQADAIPGNSPQEAADIYKSSGQLAKDQHTVAGAKARYGANGRVHWGLDEVAAQRRLDDYAAITDPDNTETSHIWYKHDQERDEAQFLAGERLNDWNVANSVGPVAKDPILGGDMRDRAKQRLYMQRALEGGQLPWHQELMSDRDAATSLMDNLEVQDRATTLTRLHEQLQNCGLSPGAAGEVVQGIEHGVPPEKYIEAVSAASRALDGGKDGVQAFGEALPTGSHWGPGVAFTASDVESFVKLGKHIGVVGSALEFGVVISELADGKPVGEVASKTLGGLAGAWALGEPLALAGGTFLGPPGAFVGGLVGGTAGAFGGEWGGDKLYKYLNGE